MPIIFLRHGKLDLQYKSHNEMPISLLADIASNKLNPSVDINFIKINLLKLEPYIKNVECIVVSSLQRGIETGNIINEFLNQKTNKKINFFIEDDLKEVSFNIEKITEGLDYIPNLSQLNNLIFESICGLREGSENSNLIFNRIKKILKKYNTENKVILIITHGFLLETLEMYIANNNIKNFNGSYDELLKSPKINYLSGFTTDNDLNIIDFISV